MAGETHGGSIRHKARIAATISNGSENIKGIISSSVDSLV